jgi:hypothetical protein
VVDVDRFPEAFERFEEDVDIESLKSYSELIAAFRLWAGERWKGTAKQWSALNIEAKRLGFEVPRFIREEIRESQRLGYVVSEGRQRALTWRHEVVTVRGSSQDRYRDIKTGRFIKKPF